MDFRRINRGSGHSYTLDGEYIPGVTTILKALDKPALVGWAGNVTAEYAVNNWDELSSVGIGTRVERLKKARYQVRDAATDAGKRVHAWAVPLLRGEDVDVPPELAGYVDAVARFLDTWHVEPVLAEAPVLNPDHWWAGTIDLQCGIDGTLWLLDWKTGKGVYPESVLQLAAYAHATHVVHPDGSVNEWTRPQRCGVVHVTPDSATLHPVDASDDAYTVFRHLAQVHAWTARVEEATGQDSPWPIGAPLHPGRAVQATP